MSARLRRFFVAASLCTSLSLRFEARAQGSAVEVRVQVRGQGEALQGATVSAGAARVETDERGEARLTLLAGRATIKASAQNFETRQIVIEVLENPAVPVTVIDLEPLVEHEEEVIVTATRSGKRVEDEPLRVEVLDREEVEEKLLMTPGDITMLLNETSGLRVQIASPSLGAANVRIQGLRGRYTQMLSDGLPLYGGQSGSISMLQIPPMDLGQVEIIKGVASALYGANALGGVINLISRQPGEKREREVLLNQTTEAGTDAVLWLSGRVNERWGYSLLTSANRQTLRDIDHDGWGDLPSFERGLLRPRLFWNDDKGRSVFATVGGLIENREGGTIEGGRLFGGTPYLEALRTRRADTGVTARLPWGTRLISLKSSFATQHHRHVFGDTIERDEHNTLSIEASVVGSHGKHTWVGGVAVQGERYSATDLPVFDFKHDTKALFAQDEIALTGKATLAVSARVDRHSVYGTFFNPRISLLLRPGVWAIRVSGGSGTFAPTPFIEETDAIGLTRVSPLDSAVKPERAFGGSIDASRSFSNWEMNVTGFASSLRRSLGLRGGGGDALRLANAVGPVQTRGAEGLIRWRRQPVVITATYTLTHASEAPLGGARKPTALTPTHAAGLVGAFERPGKGRAGIEVYYVGRQSLDDDPFRAESRAYFILGFIAERRFGRARVFINAENLADSRQTRWSPLVRSHPALDGRRTVDAWAPLEGRIFNGGVRLEF